LSLPSFPGLPRGRGGVTDRFEPWLDRKALAEHLGCSVRSVELRMAEGMPCWRVMGRVKFRASEVEPWLEEHGYIRLATKKAAA
jgi:hypothetical protein